MTSIGMVVEGLGDRRSVPSLIAKTAMLFEKQLFVRHVVEGGGWDKQKKQDELEKNCVLAAADDDVKGIIVLVDLEDDCAKVESEKVRARLESIAYRLGVPVHLCFCVREYESWFLRSFESIRENSTDIEWAKVDLEAGAVERRGAKECFERHLGAHYRQTIDQEKFTKRMDLRQLLESDRSFQKLAKIVDLLAE